MHLFLLLIFFSFVSSFSSISTKPIWSQNPIDPLKWAYGEPFGPGETYFCNEKVSKEVCPFSSNSSSYLQFYGSNGEYWTAITLDLTEVTTTTLDKGQDYIVQLTDVNIHFVDEEIITLDTPWKAPQNWYATFLIYMDSSWISEVVVLSEQSEGYIPALNFHFKNHTGLPKALEFAYVTFNNNGTRVYMLVGGVSLWWV